MKLTTALLACLAAAPTVLGAGASEWKSRNIYFALTDRFATDDGNASACESLGDYCGGTFKGLESQLDYIQGMGFDAIWITPVVSNTPGGYHGYWAKDLYEVNENYGTADDLKSFVNAAHEKGIYVMADVVANHMGEAAFGEHAPEPLNQESSYHSNCEINYDDQSSVEQCWIAGLPDLATEKAEVAEVLNTWISWLVEEYGFDGLRIDTVKHVEKEFWPDFVSAAGVYSVGEVWDGDVDYLAGYAELMDGLLDYGIYYPVNDFYQQKGSSKAIADTHDRISDKFPDPAALATFIDNHDNPRWLSQKNDVTLLKNALAYVILSRGIPIVYYGTEQGYAGGNDPANREDLWRSGYDTDADIYQAIAKLSSARAEAGGLGDDDHVHLSTQDGVYAWSRADGKLIVLTTNGGSGSEASAEYCFDSKVADGSWVDVFNGDGQEYSSGGDALLCVTVTDGLPVVLAASSS